MIISTLLAAAVATSSANNPWVDIGTGTMGTAVSINRTSFEVIPDRDGQTFRTVTFRMTKTGVITFARFIVFDNVCQAGSGEVYVLSLDSSNVEKHGYIKDGGSLITTIADVVCAVRADRVLQADPKGGRL